MLVLEDKNKRMILSIDLDHEVIYGLMVVAHERDITLNALVEQILERAIAERKAE